MSRAKAEWQRRKNLTSVFVTQAGQQGERKKEKKRKERKSEMNRNTWGCER